MEQLPKRQTAYKFWIKDIVEAEASVSDEGRLFFKVKEKDVARVNLMANIIHKYVSGSGNYVFVTLDDGSGQIRVKAWNDDTGILTNYNVGDPIIVVGKLGLNNNEIFIRPEVLKKMENNDWELVRKLELIKLYGKFKGEKSFVKDEEEVVDQIIVEEVIVSDSPSIAMREKVISAIEVADKDGLEEGVLLKEVGGSEEEVMQVVQDLLSEGEIFQPKKGFLKLIG